MFVLYAEEKGLCENCKVVISDLFILLFSYTVKFLWQLMLWSIRAVKTLQYYWLCGHLRN